MTLIRPLPTTKSRLTEDRQKFVAFPIANQTLAIPLSNVLRVLRHEPDKQDSDLNRLGLLQIGRYTIRVLNLHQWLTPNFTSVNPTSQPFLIVARSAEWEPFCIWADGLPDLVELAPNAWRSLPPSASASSGFLELISHTAAVAYGEGNKTVFLLDIPRALNARAPEIMALPS
ncbi:MAG: chemotaxis protein CheW [Cyanobacteria bacterium P01_F01_bin.86]